MAPAHPTPGRPASVLATSDGGLDLAPFRGVRYAVQDAEQLARLTCPPYDVIDERQHRALEEADPHNVVRLILPRADGSGPTSAGSGAARLLRSWRDSGVLATDPVPALYVYEMRDQGTSVRGLIGALALRRPETGVVLPHEDTMPGPVRQRQDLIAATGANLEPIYLVAEGAPGASSAAVKDATRDRPLAALVASDGSEHRLWGISDPEILARIHDDLLPRRALIADGHHRYAAYLAHQEQQHGLDAGPGPWDRGLAFLVDSDIFGAHVHAFHRVVADRALPEAVEQAGHVFTVTSLAPGELGALGWLAERLASGPAYVLTDGVGSFGLSAPNRGLLDRLVPADRSPAWQALDVVALHRVLFTEIWRLRVSEESVRYVADAAAAVELAREMAGFAVLLNPTPLETVLTVAGAGERMPQKSTLFTPKPRTGLVLRVYDDERSTSRDPDRR
ncbi:MAG: DUF1015 domain-containing protein [Actinobacteria bacterium]|nr:DUF1015 domain-containing protein [Actinomycetota bacterium]